MYHSRSVLSAWVTSFYYTGNGQFKNRYRVGFARGQHAPSLTRIRFRGAPPRSRRGEKGAGKGGGGGGGGVSGELIKKTVINAGHMQPPGCY